MSSLKLKVDRVHGCLIMVANAVVQHLGLGAGVHQFNIKVSSEAHFYLKGFTTRGLEVFLEFRSLNLRTRKGFNLRSALVMVSDKTAPLGTPTNAPNGWTERLVLCIYEDKTAKLKTRTLPHPTAQQVRGTAARSKS